MPNIHVTGLTPHETMQLSRLASAFFERELGTPGQSVYVFHREARLFRAGTEQSDLPAILEVGWVKRPREQVLRAIGELTRIVREDLGRAGSIQVEIHEKWDDAGIDGELCSEWARKRRAASPAARA